jgi:hypothetical protein
VQVHINPTQSRVINRISGPGVGAMETWMVETSFEAIGGAAAFPVAKVVIGALIVTGIAGVFVASRLFANYSARIHRRWKLFQFR